MSAIDPTVPGDSELRSLGASRIREHRTWLYDFATAFLVRHHGSGYDPVGWSGELKIPTTAPGSPQVGDFYITSTGLVYSYKTGPTVQLTGDLAAATEAVFRQSSAPTGWTRNTTTTDGSGLRYKTSGTADVGGSSALSSTLSHAGLFGTFTDQFLGSGAVGFYEPVAAHPALKYVDVMTAVRT